MLVLFTIRPPKRLTVYDIAVELDHNDRVFIVYKSSQIAC